MIKEIFNFIILVLLVCCLLASLLFTMLSTDIVMIHRGIFITIILYLGMCEWSDYGN